MGETTKPEAFIISLERDDLPPIKAEWSEATSTLDGDMHVEFEAKASPETMEAFNRWVEENENFSAAIQQKVEEEARKAVDCAFHGLGRRKMNELYDFAEKLAISAWNACYNYHKERIER